MAWHGKESYYAQIEVAKRQKGIRGAPKEMSDRDLMLTVEQACIAAGVDPRHVDLSIPKVHKEDGSVGRGPVQFISFLTASERRAFMEKNKESTSEGTKLRPWTYVKVQRSQMKEVSDEEKSRPEEDTGNEVVQTARTHREIRNSMRRSSAHLGSHSSRGASRRPCMA